MRSLFAALTTFACLALFFSRHLSTIQFLGEGVKPMGLVVAPDGKRLYVTTGRFRRLFAVDTTTNQIVNSLEVGERPWGVAVLQ